MKVRSGWNSEYARKKYDVELEEADLARILMQNGLDPAFTTRLSTGVAHCLLHWEAEILSRQTLVEHDPEQAQHQQQVIGDFTAKRDELVKRLKAKLGTKA